MDTNTILIVIAVALGFYVAWNIGANDVANAMGTSVGSGALTMKKAIILAAILEFCGAFFVGSHVSETVEKGILHDFVFAHNPRILVYGMLSALFASGVWLQIASYFGWPVSTTHSLIGAIVGFGVVVGGVHSVQWDEVLYIGTSWVLSPLISGVISYAIFNLIKRTIFHQKRPLLAAKKLAPFLVFFIFMILTLMMVFKGLANLDLNLDFFPAVGVAVLVGLIAANISWFFIRRIKVKVETTSLRVDSPYDPKLPGHLDKVQKYLLKAEKESFGELQQEVQKVLVDVQSISEMVEVSGDQSYEHAEYAAVEKMFGILQILSACFMAFAHGANDVANAIGPLNACLSILRTGFISEIEPITAGILALGGIGIVVGLATWGWRVIETIGKKITELTPSRGFAAEFGAATTIVVASKLGLPISTTHSLVGSVLGVGLARGLTAVNLQSIRHIVYSWIITIPAGAILAIAFYYMFERIFGL